MHVVYVCIYKICVYVVVLVYMYKIDICIDVSYQYHILLFQDLLYWCLCIVSYSCPCFIDSEVRYFLVTFETFEVMSVLDANFLSTEEVFAA